MSRESGVYQILNRINGKRYVGSAINLSRRWAAHRSGLRRGEHENIHLQRAWNLYGGKAFAFAVLEYVSNLERLIEREQHYLDALQPEYNIAPMASNPMLGRNHTEETRQKMSKAQKGRVHTEEARCKMSEAGKGRLHTAETRRKIGEAQKGRVLSEATKQKISEAHTGKVLSAEHRQRLSEVKRGENGSSAKLTEQDVRGIKALLQESVLLQREIAVRYGVSAETIGSIKHGRTWSYVSGEGEVKAA